MVEKFIVRQKPSFHQSIFIIKRLKLLTSLIDEHRKFTLQVLQLFSGQPEKNLFHYCPQQLIRCLCKAIVNPPEATLHCIKKVTWQKLKTIFEFCFSKKNNLEAKGRPFCTQRPLKQKFILATFKFRRMEAFAAAKMNSWCMTVAYVVELAKDKNGNIC